MLKKPDLKNRFKILESRLSGSSENASKKSQMTELSPSRYPETHKILRESSERETELIFFQKSLKSKTGRPNIPELSGSFKVIEESLHQCFSILTGKSCIFQLMYNNSSGELEFLRSLNASLRTDQNFWNVVLAGEDCLKLQYKDGNGEISIPSFNKDIRLVETTLKDANFKSKYLQAFNIINNSGNVEIKLKFKSLGNRSQAQEREITV